MGKLGFLIFYYDLRMAWIDISNLNAKVPYVNGSIYIKILILKSEE